MSQERIDIVVLGATGFCGSRTVYALLNLAKEYGMLTCGIAARNPKKLQSLLQEISKRGYDTSVLTTIIADVNDEESLLRMTSRTKVIINCVGPYRFFGEPVVKACITTKTHHLDVSGEPQFMEEMQLYHHKAAAEQEVYVVSACGMSGIPADLGTIHFMDLFDGTLNQIELLVHMDFVGPAGTPIHYATYASAIHSLAHKHELYNLRKKLFSIPLPRLQPKLKPRCLLHKSNIINQWCLPYSGADKSVSRRSQYYLHNEIQHRPVQIEAYFSVGNLFYTLVVIVLLAFVMSFAVLSKFTRELLLKYPSFFTLGNVSHDGPSDVGMDNVIFNMTYVGKGWSNKKVENECSLPMDKSMIMKFIAKNPGYGFTCNAVILAAITILNEKELLPGKGGVYPPGAAFGKTSLLNKMKKHGVKIEVVE